LTWKRSSDAPGRIQLGLSGVFPSSTGLTSDLDSLTARHSVRVAVVSANLGAFDRLNTVSQTILRRDELHDQVSFVEMLPEMPGKTRSDGTQILKAEITVPEYPPPPGQCWALWIAEVEVHLGREGKGTSDPNNLPLIPYEDLIPLA
jgi:hypothetical protein